MLVLAVKYSLIVPQTVSGFEIARSDLSNIDDAEFLAKAIAAGVPSESGSIAEIVAGPEISEKLNKSSITMIFESRCFFSIITVYSKKN